MKPEVQIPKNGEHPNTDNQLSEKEVNFEVNDKRKLLTKIAKGDIMDRIMYIISPLDPE